ncbi:hypothetical protein [Massilia sp. CT11-137]|uniref:hypothetical protein n=1 Tax=Massilia sp. CT11-137 TaxID=3393901 RepID=UPI0039B07007
MNKIGSKATFSHRPFWITAVFFAALIVEADAYGKEITTCKIAGGYRLEDSGGGWKDHGWEKLGHSATLSSTDNGYDIKVGSSTNEARSLKKDGARIRLYDSDSNTLTFLINGEDGVQVWTFFKANDGSSRVIIGGSGRTEGAIQGAVIVGHCTKISKFDLD